MKYNLIDAEHAARTRNPSVTEPPIPPPPKPPRHGLSQFARAHLGTITLKDVLYLAGLVLTAVTWAQSRASRDEVEVARRSCVDSSASAITSALAPIVPLLPNRVKALEKREARNDTRWDRLDTWHGRAFAKPYKTPPPKFGPGAERRGEVRYEEEEEE